MSSGAVKNQTKHERVSGISRTIALLALPPEVPSGGFHLIINHHIVKFHITSGFQANAEECN